MFDTKVLPPDDGRAHPLGDARRHMRLVRDMARVTGVDFEQAHADGALTIEGWAETVTRCRGCRHADTCEGWLRTRPAGVVAPPEECLNAPLFKALR